MSAKIIENFICINFMIMGKNHLLMKNMRHVCIQSECEHSRRSSVIQFNINTIKNLYENKSTIIFVLTNNLTQTNNGNKGAGLS